MIYLLPTCSTMKGLPPWYGVICNPGAWAKLRKPVQEGRWWAADNAAFAGKFEPTWFWKWLQLHRPYRDRCLFVAVPDVLGCWRSTLLRWNFYAPWLEATGLPLAYVLQDGQPYDTLPEAAWYFLGGSTEFKLSEHAANLLLYVQLLGARVHVGRVNSAKRIRRFGALGVDSVDGTCSRFAGLEKTMDWFDPPLQELHRLKYFNERVDPT